MKVKKKILAKIHTKDNRRAIASILNIGEHSVYLAMEENKRNGRMTKMDFLLAIASVIAVGVTEILEGETIEALK